MALGFGGFFFEGPFPTAGAVRIPFQEEPGYWDLTILPKGSLWRLMEGLGFCKGSHSFVGTWVVLCPF